VAQHVFGPFSFDLISTARGKINFSMAKLPTLERKIVHFCSKKDASAGSVYEHPVQS
jgi:hypothetical protein